MQNCQRYFKKATRVKILNDNTRFLTRKEKKNKNKKYQILPTKSMRYKICKYFHVMFEKQCKNNNNTITECINALV